jgi:DNA topoisomerase IA
MITVWVIEASGKKDAFLLALKDAGFVGDKVLATFGRLYDLPEDRLGFDAKMISHPELTTEISWEPKRRDQVLKLIDLIGRADHVVIATDTDLEGELIASQVEGLCQLAHKKTGKEQTVCRVHLHSITAHSLKAAYAKRTVVNQNKVRAAKARRVLDRLLGYRLHSSNDPWRLSTGRVVTPLVHSLHTDPAEAVVLRKKLDDGWSAIVRLDSRQAPQAETVLGMLHALPRPPILVDRTESLTHEYKPLTGPEAIKLCMRSLSSSPRDIQRSIQDNYEKGRLSYPRTDSRTLDEIGLKWVSRMASKEAIEYDDQLATARQAEVLERSYDAHHALIPIGDHVPHSSIPGNYLSSDEAVLRVIGNHSMHIGESAEQFTREHGVLDTKNASGARWAQVMGKWSKELTFIRDVDSTGFEQDPLRYEITRTPDTLQSMVSCWQHPPAQIVMERLMDIGLGRPSTVLGLAEKTFTTYLDKSGHVNGRGVIMLEKLMERLPELLNPETARAIESAVCDVEADLSIGTRLANAWNILKRNPTLLGTTDPITFKTKSIDLVNNDTQAVDNVKDSESFDNSLGIY